MIRYAIGNLFSDLAMDVSRQAFEISELILPSLRAWNSSLSYLIDLPHLKTIWRVSFHFYRIVNLSFRSL